MSSDIIEEKPSERKCLKYMGVTIYRGLCDSLYISSGGDERAGCPQNNGRSAHVSNDPHQTLSGIDTFSHQLLSDAQLKRVESIHEDDLWLHKIYCSCGNAVQ